MASTVRFGRVGGTIVLVCGQPDPSNEDWTIWSNYYANTVLEHGTRRLFVVSAGGGPNARQRKEVISTLVRNLGADVAEQLATAACGSSTSVRIVTAALGWLAGVHRMKAFRNDERERALEYLKVPREQRPEVLRLAKRFEAELAGTGILASDAGESDGR
jgi:hypothetical protein